MNNDNSVQIADFALPVFRLMNESYIRFILVKLQREMNKQGWKFEATKTEYKMPRAIKEGFARDVFSAQTEFLHPYLLQDSELFKRWADDSIEDGYSWSWLASILDALSKLGIRPVPVEENEKSQGTIND